MNKYINELVTLLGIYLSISVIWILLEKIILGGAIPNPVDAIIAIILTFSLEGNLNTWNRNKDNKNG